MRDRHVMQRRPQRLRHRKFPTDHRQGQGRRARRRIRRRCRWNDTGRFAGCSTLGMNGDGSGGDHQLAEGGKRPSARKSSIQGLCPSDTGRGLPTGRSNPGDVTSSVWQEAVTGSGGREPGCDGPPARSHTNLDRAATPRDSPGPERAAGGQPACGRGVSPRRQQSLSIKPATPRKLSTNQRRGRGKTAVNLRLCRRGLCNSQRPLPVVGRGGFVVGGQRDWSRCDVCRESRNVVWQKGIREIPGKRCQNVSTEFDRFRHGIFAGRKAKPQAVSGGGNFFRVARPIQTVFL